MASMLFSSFQECLTPYFLWLLWWNLSFILLSHPATPCSFFLQVLWSSKHLLVTQCRRPARHALCSTMAGLWVCLALLVLAACPLSSCAGLSVYPTFPWYEPGYGGQIACGWTKQISDEDSGPGGLKLVGQMKKEVVSGYHCQPCL